MRKGFVPSKTGGSNKEREKRLVDLMEKNDLLLIRSTCSCCVYYLLNLPESIIKYLLWDLDTTTELFADTVVYKGLACIPRPWDQWKDLSWCGHHSWFDSFAWWGGWRCSREQV